MYMNKSQHIRTPRVCDNLTRAKEKLTGTIIRINIVKKYV